MEMNKILNNRVGKDLEHLNSVLYTIADTVEKEVKEKNIKKIKIEGAGGEQDTGGFFDDTLRAKLYLRFLNRRYPNGAVETAGRFINIDMTKVFPDIIKDEKNKMDMIVDELVKISDADPNREGIMRGVDGADESQFSISTDFIDSSKHGTIYVEIDVWDETGNYNIDWDIMDIGDEGSKSFNSFEELLNFIKTKFD